MCGNEVGRPADLPVELRAPRRCNFDLGELNIFHTDQGFAPRGSASVKLQELPETDWRALAPPIEVFRFDWASAPLDEVCRPRHNPSLLARIKDDGVLNAFVVYFRLHLDDDDVFDTGPANPKLVAWDQAPPRPSPPTLRSCAAPLASDWRCGAPCFVGGALPSGGAARAPRDGIARERVA